MAKLTGIFCLLTLILVGCKSDPPASPAQPQETTIIKVEPTTTTEVPAQPVAQTEVLPPTPPPPEPTYQEKVHKVYEALTLAEDIIGRAVISSTVTYDQKIKFQKILESLQNADLAIPPEGENFQNCYFGVMAFTVRYDSRIGICRISLETEKEHIAQNIIHEAAHLSGTWDECEATKLETAIMIAGNGKVDHNNDYVAGCSL